jgi:hypothetical protein
VLSYNLFTEEFPDLRKDDQTKEELMNRLEQLSDSLWTVIETRKDESIDKIKQMSEVGWSDQESRNLCRNLGAIIEIEIKRFETIYQIVMMAEPPVALDAEIFIKKHLDRGSKPYDGQTHTSPVLTMLMQNLLKKLYEVININPTVQQVFNDNQGEIMRQEMKIFIYRLALINSWGLVLLENIHVKSRVVYNILDDWIVTAVQHENQNTKQVVDFLKEAI